MSMSLGDMGGKCGWRAGGSSGRLAGTHALTRPPTPSDASSSSTGTPASCNLAAACRPATPAPTTTTSGCCDAAPAATVRAEAAAARTCGIAAGGRRTQMREQRRSAPAAPAAAASTSAAASHHQLSRLALHLSARTLQRPSHRMLPPVGAARRKGPGDWPAGRGAARGERRRCPGRQHRGRSVELC